MKTIYLIRHAKAEEKTSAIKDFGRHLTTKGIRDAEKMGKRLVSMHIHPDKIISSSARRAIQTAKIISRNLKYANEIIVNENIYHTSGAKIIAIIQKTEDEIQSLMLVGHNPSFNGMLHHLCETNIDNIPKAGIVGITLNVDKWSSISDGCGVILFFDSPKNK
ncbi:MAG: histidine phosphatase family protein [Bacteroidota bacterium]